MTRYFLVTILMVCLLVYAIYKSKFSPMTKLNRFFICFLLVIGLTLIFINLGLEIPGLNFQRSISGLTTNLVFFGLLFIHQSNNETHTIRSTPLTIITILILVLFFISFIYNLNDIASNVYTF